VKVSSSIAAGLLCQECGLCCNGAIFGDVKLQPRDDAARLKAIGLCLNGSKTFRQPCSAFDGCRCLIYSQRPEHCRRFECLLLKELQAGRVEENGALKTIHSAREKLRKVNDLFRALGNEEEHLSIRERYRRVEQALQRRKTSEPQARSFGELTLAVHDLNLILSERFYS